MKKLFVKILSGCLLFAAVMEDISPFFSNDETPIIALEKEENKGKELEKEKDGKEKLFQDQFIYLAKGYGRALYFTDSTCFKYPAYISIPEIPPKQA